jgi:hypothetical protein
MPSLNPPEQLRLELQAIPAVRAAVDDALAELSSQLLRLRHQAIIPEPWLGDPTSASVLAHYQQRVVEAADGPLAAMRAYEAELVRIRDTLQVMEDQYLRADGEIAGGLGRV